MGSILILLNQKLQHVDLTFVGFGNPTYEADAHHSLGILT